MSRKRPTISARLQLPKSFNELNAVHPLRPISDKIDFENAQEITDRLAVLNQRTRDQDDFLETLVTLMEKYEAENLDLQLRKRDPIECLRYLLDAHDMTPADLGNLLGNRELGYAIMRGDRDLSKANIAVVAKQFSVSPALFLED